MRTGTSSSKWISSLAAVLILVTAGSAGAFSYFNGKIEVHGFFAEQIRVLANDFDPNQEFDLAQWYNVFDVEIEGKPFPNGIGPLEIVEFYTRVEAATTASGPAPAGCSRPSTPTEIEPSTCRPG